MTPLQQRKLFDLQQEQADKRSADARAGVFMLHEMDEIKALSKLALQLFGEANVKHDWIGGDEPHQYGGLIEGGPEEPGVWYMGFYIDRKSPLIPHGRRRRKLLFRGCKVSEFEAQARLVGMLN